MQKREAHPAGTQVCMCVCVCVFMIKVSSVREIADGRWRMRLARVACFTAMMIIIMMATLHAPATAAATASVCQPVVLQPCVLCVFVFLFPVPLVAASLYFSFRTFVTHHK